MSRSDSNGRNPQHAAVPDGIVDDLADSREAATEVDRAIGAVLRAMTHLDEAASDPARTIAALRARSHSHSRLKRLPLTEAGSSSATGASGIDGTTDTAGMNRVVPMSRVSRIGGVHAAPARAAALATAAAVLLAAGGATLWYSTRPTASGKSQDTVRIARNAAPTPQSVPPPPESPQSPRPPEGRPQPHPQSQPQAPQLAQRAPVALSRTLPTASPASSASASAVRLSLGEPVEEIAVAAIDPTPLDAADAVGAPQLATDVIATEPIRVASVDAPTTPRSH